MGAIKSQRWGILCSLGYRNGGEGCGGIDTRGGS